MDQVEDTGVDLGSNIVPVKNRRAKIVKLSSGFVKQEDEPPIVINGRETVLSSAKPIKLKDEEKIKEAIQKAVDAVEKQETKLIENKLGDKDYQKIYERWIKLKQKHEDIDMPDMADRSYAAILKYRVLYQNVVKEKMRSSISTYKKLLIVFIATVELGAKYMEFDLDGFTLVHVENMHQYSDCFGDMARDNDGVGFMEGLSPTTRLITGMAINSFVFLVFKYLLKKDAKETLKYTRATCGLIEGDIEKATNDPDLNIMGMKLSTIVDMGKDLLGTPKKESETVVETKKEEKGSGDKVRSAGPKRTSRIRDVNQTRITN